MDDKRLNTVIIICEKYITDILNIDNLVNKLALLKHCRVQILKNYTLVSIINEIR